MSIKHAMQGRLLNNFYLFAIKIFLQNRRKKLKDATTVRRDEFDLEERCITAVDSLTSDLRSSIDQVVK
jgi:hypothetical protein